MGLRRGAPRCKGATGGSRWDARTWGVTWKAMGLNTSTVAVWESARSEGRRSRCADSVHSCTTGARARAVRRRGSLCLNEPLSLPNTPTPSIGEDITQYGRSLRALARIARVFVFAASTRREADIFPDTGREAQD